MFFVISGFLITITSLNRWTTLPKVSLSGFYTMRFARIIPLLVGLLMVLSILHLTGITGFVINPERTSLGRAFFAAITFHINWLEMKVGYLPGSWDILWTLSIEEVFYLFFPLLCVLCGKEWHFVAIISAFLIISPLARTLWFQGNELGDKNNFAYLDAISIGCMSALFTKRVNIKNWANNTFNTVGWGLIVFILVFRSVANQWHLIETGLNVTVLAIGTAFVLIGMQKNYINGRQNPSQYTSVLRFFGRNSYEVYLTHMFVVLLLVYVFKLSKLSGNWTWILYISALITSGILGNLVSQYMSNPMNTLIRKRFKT
jgi:peptidoglycan/LPS O-acetylase OafA/YrhL